MIGTKGYLQRRADVPKNRPPKDPFFTVGHSNRSIGEFIDILRDANITMVVDVRRLPASLAYPHFNKDALALSLAEVQIAYEYAAPLGGRRRKVRGCPLKQTAPGGTKASIITPITHCRKSSRGD